MTDNDQSRRSGTDRERSASVERSRTSDAEHPHVADVERSLASEAAAAVSRRNLLLAAATAGAVGVPGRVGGASSAADPPGAVAIDGSEAYRQASAAVAGAVRREHSGVELSVRDSGTAEGFRRFAAGELDAHVAGRPMLPAERERAAANDVAFERVELALGGAALVHSRREWYDPVRPRQLAATWADAGEAETYAELADARTGKPALDPAPSAALRDDPAVAAPSDDARVVARGTRAFQYERGFGGLGHYEPDAADVRSLAAVGRDERYTPLVRLAFLYLGRESAGRGAVEAFERAYRERAARTTGEVTYFADPTEAR